MIIGIGIDLVELERIRRFGTERLARRLLTERERACLPRSERRILEFLAGRFAAKEAVAKAAGTGIGKLSFQDIEIIPDEKSCPQVRLSRQGRAALNWEESVRLHLSITHSTHYATAMVVAERI